MCHVLHIFNMAVTCLDSGQDISNFKVKILTDKVLWHIIFNMFILKQNFLHLVLHLLLDCNQGH